MKTIYSCLIILFFISCSTEPVLEQSAHAMTGNSVSQLTAKDSLSFPSNRLNPYDFSGAIYSELFDSYFDGTALPSTVNGVISRVSSAASSNLRFEALKGTLYQNVTESTVTTLLTTTETSISDVINATALSSIGKSSLISFVNSFLLYTATEDNDVAIYMYIISYEDSILQMAQLTEKDRMQLLTTTSIARYSICERKKRPKKNTDPDWDILIANIIGATQGSTTGSAEAITLSLAAGIAQNTL